MSFDQLRMSGPITATGGRLISSERSPLPPFLRLAQDRLFSGRGAILPFGKENLGDTPSYLKGDLLVGQPAHQGK